MTEWELIELLKQKDESAFKTIVETWQNMVYNTALGIVQFPEDAEDIAQEVFVRVYESINSFKGESKFSTWIYRITVTRSLDHLRRKKRKKRFAFVESLFGKNDEWHDDKSMTFHSKEEVNHLLEDMEIVSLDEQEKDEPKASGDMKHWHVFHVMARKI